MYADIASNKRRSFFLIFLFVVLIVGLGWFFGYISDVPELGIVLATIIAAIMVLIGYFQGDSIALLTAGAKPIEKRDHPELYRLVENLSIAAGLPCPKIYIIQDAAANAFAAGRKPETASIAVTTGLIQMMDKRELEAVIAHEMSHIKNYDILVMTLVVVLVGTIVLFSDIMLRSFLFRGNRDNNGQAALILFLIGILLAGLSPLFAQLIKLAVSRSREYLADASAALLTRYPEGLASALEKIASQDRPLKRANHATAHLFLANPFDPHVTKRFESLFSTHPPINDRIERLRTMGH